MKITANKNLDFDEFKYFNKKYSSKNISKYQKRLQLIDENSPSDTSFMYLINFSTKNLLFTTQNQERCTGFSNSKLLEGGLDFLLSRIHDKERELVIESITTIFDKIQTIRKEEIMQVGFQLNYRWLHSNGSYLNIINNFMPLEIEGNEIPYLWFAQSRVIGENEVLPIKAICRRLNTNKNYDTLLDLNMVEYFFMENFTNRENEIISLLSEGCKSKEIADRLHISFDTVKTHRKNIRGKFRNEDLIDLLNISGLKLSI